VLTRHLRLLAAVVSIPLCTGCGAYMAYGPSMLPYQGHALRPSAELHLGISRPEYPHWTVAWSGTSSSSKRDSATFFEPNCYTGTLAEEQSGTGKGCHPRIFQTSTALLVQYRWLTDRRARPTASVAFGSSSARYLYRIAERSVASDSLRTSPIVTLRGGGEFGITSWAHVNLMAGYQTFFGDVRMKPIGSNSGFTLTSMLVFGQRYRTPVSGAKPTK
jgi:hypothetical protein